MPVVVSKLNYYRHKHWEGFLLVGLEYVEEVIIFKEAHCSVSDLEMDTSYASNNSLEQSRNQMVNLVYFANFENFLQFSQE
jgi:hypothetical protein